MPGNGHAHANLAQQQWFFGLILLRRAMSRSLQPNLRVHEYRTWYRPLVSVTSPHSTAQRKGMRVAPLLRSVNANDRVWNMSVGLNAIAPHSHSYRAASAAAHTCGVCSNEHVAWCLIPAHLACFTLSFCIMRSLNPQ